MFNKFISSILVVILMFGNTIVFSQTSKIYSLSNFDEIEVLSNFKVKITYDETFKVSSSVRNKVDMKDLEVKVINRRLIIGYKENTRIWNKKTEQVEFDIKMPLIKQVNLSNIVRAEIDGFKNLQSLFINISGESTANLNINTDKLFIRMAGESKATLFGNTNHLSAFVTGASQLDASNYNLNTSLVEIDASGKGIVTLNTVKQLYKNQSGWAKIYYKGNPTIKNSASSTFTAAFE